MIDLTGKGAHVIRGGVATDLLGLAGAPLVQATDPLHGLYAIGDHGTIQVYTQFAGYRTALESDIAAGRQVSIFGARGVFDDASDSISAGRMFSALQ